jgi:L-lactate dehydrogenase complex protein LldE
MLAPRSRHRIEVLGVSDSPPTVGLFVTCLVDLFRPSVGFAAVHLLEGAGCRVVVPGGQTCCGQPAYNSGARDIAAGIAADVIEAFEEFDYVVAPSGSCAAMLKLHFPGLFAEGTPLRARAARLAERSWELMSFLTDVRGVREVASSCDASAVYHDGCSGLRELGVRDQPRRLLSSVAGLEIREMDDTEVCCGFGGAFCVKYPAISGDMVDRKAEAIEATGAALVVAGEIGCLMNIAGRLSRRGAVVEARHAAEILAGMTDAPAIGAGE